MNTLQEIPIKKIKVVENHRTNINKTDLHELMLSIKQNGLQQPIGVSQSGKEGFVLIFGHRRLLACEKLGWTTIPAQVEKNVSKERHLILNLTENLQRKDPTFAELGRVIFRLKDELGLSTSEVAARLGIERIKVKMVCDAYECLPEQYRHRIVFMEKGLGRKSKEGAIPASVANKIVNLTKQHGLSKKAVTGLMDYVGDNGADKADVENVGIMLDSGLGVDQAVKAAGDYKVYSFHFVARREEVELLMSRYQAPIQQELFRMMIYGEIGGVKRPSFLNSSKPKMAQAKKTEKPAPKINLDRIQHMRDALAAQDRLKKLTEEQSMALRSTGKIPAKQWTPEQCEQIKSMYNTVGGNNLKV